jgi:hypothetical protein
MGLMFLEVVYETGRMSVMEVDTLEEGLEGLRVHNDKAKKGEPGGPLGQPAERVAAVYQYDGHPNDYNEDQTMSAEVAEKTVKELIASTKNKDGVVSLDNLAQQVRSLSHPMNNENEIEGFGSRYKVKEEKVVDMAFLDAKGGAS